MEGRNKKGTWILIGFITFGIASIYIAYRTNLLAQAKKKVMNAIESTRLEAYDKEDRGRVRRLMRQYQNRVRKARSKVDIEAAKQSFDDALSNIRTSARKLTDERVRAVGNMYDDVMSRYGVPGSERAAELASRYAEQIRSAVNRESVRKLQSQFRSQMRRAGR